MIPIAYLAAISLIATILTVRDKRAAVKGAWRVRERTLLATAVLGGSAAMLATMLIVRHKTCRKKFMVGLPLIIAAQTLFAVTVFNHSLSVSHVSVTTDKVDGQIKLALITDFHSCDYGNGHRELTAAVDAERPDAVLFVGDNFDDRQPPDNTEHLMRGLAEKYACFYVTGNHDTDVAYRGVWQRHHAGVGLRHARRKGV